MQSAALPFTHSDPQLNKAISTLNMNSLELTYKFEQDSILLINKIPKNYYTTLNKVSTTNTMEKRK